MKIVRPIVSILLCVGLVLSHMPGTAFAASEILYIDCAWDEATNTVISTTKSIKESECTVVTENTTSLSDGWYVVRGEVTVSSRMTVSGEVHLILLSGSQLVAGEGIAVNENDTFCVYTQFQSSDVGEIVVETDGENAALGGDTGMNAGTIVVNGGVITASSQKEGAAIGGGSGGDGGNITVYTGVIKVSLADEDGGAGIGGGYQGDGGNITIYGGSIVVEIMAEDVEGAGIGGGDSGDGGNITIHGGTVVVIVESETNWDWYLRGAGIGGGDSGDGGNITINGGYVKVESTFGAGIGGGDCGDGGSITINGGVVTAYSSDEGAGIGGGSGGFSGNITINGGKIEAHGNYGAGIGSGYLSAYRADEKITINGGLVIAGSYYSAAIGYGCEEEYDSNIGGSRDITITGGKVIATTTGGVGAAIGGGLNRDAGNIIISNGEVTVKNDFGYDNTLIGGGRYGSGGNVTILSDSVSFIKTKAEQNTVGPGVGGEGGSYMVRDGKVITVGGQHTLPMDYTIPEGVTLIVEAGAHLEIPEGVTLTNNGTVVINGTWTTDGQWINNGELILCNNHSYSQDCDKTCNQCGYVRQDAITHTCEDGICALCNEACDDKLVYTAEQNVIMGHCPSGTCHGSLTLQAPENLTYGNVGEITVKGELDGVETPVINYTYRSGRALSEAPKTVGDYYATITVGKWEEAVTAKLPYRIDGITPTTDMFIVTPPDDLRYDGQGKEVTVTVTNDQINKGSIAVAYYKITDGEEEYIEWNERPTEPGMYKVKLYVYEGEKNNESENVHSQDSWTFEITKATPQIRELPTVKRDVYDPRRTLSDDDLVGGEMSVAGSWSWKEENIVPTVDNEGYVAVFTPEDTEHYEMVEATIPVEVSKATPYSKNAPTATSLTYGQTLADAVLSGGAVQHSESDESVVEGTFSWKESKIKPSVLDSGITEYTVVFTPADSANYNPVQTKTTVEVNKATNALGMPEAIMNATYNQKTVADVRLPINWTWQDSDKEKVLTVGEAVTATAVYAGDDNGNFENESIVVSITRQACVHQESEVIFTEANEKAPTCGGKGIGHTVCDKCGEVLRSGVEVDATGRHIGDTHCQDCGIKLVNANPNQGAQGDGSQMPSPQPGGESMLTPVAHKVGAVYTDDSGKAKYKVTKLGPTKGTVTYVKPAKKKTSNVVVPATATINGVTYKVTAIDKNACKNNKYIKKVTIGNNVTKIGAKAFYGCKKLKKLTIKSTKLTTKKVGKKAFGKTAKKMTVKVPKKKVKAYKTMLKKRGISKKAKIKK